MEGKRIGPHSRSGCILILVIFLGLNYCFCNELYVIAQTDQTTQILQTANNSLGQAFDSVLDAEKAGGNVTQLLAKLNTAGTILAYVQNTLNSGSTENVTSNIENVLQMANQINDDALKFEKYKPC